MTEKDFMDEPVLLTEKEQAELREEQEYFRAQFAQVSCPPLPDSLRAENIWNKICAGEGDGEITVDPSEMEEKSVKSDKVGQVIAFPTATKEQSSEKKEKVTVFSGKNRRRWAIACTLVLAVGLSATFAVMQQPMKTAESMVDSDSQDIEQDAPQTRQMPQNEAQPTPEQAADDADTEENEAQVGAALQESAAAEPESAPEIEEAAVAETESVEKDSDTPAQASAAQQEQAVLKSVPAPARSAEEGQDKQSAEEALKQQILTALGEQPQQEAEQQVSYPLSSGSVSYSAQSGEAILYDRDGQQTSVISLPQSAQIIVNQDHIYAAVSEQGSVRTEGYSVKDLANPEKTIEFSQQGQLLDWYASEETGCTVVTSFVVTEQQTEEGDFLPIVDGAVVPAQQIQITESQLPEETGKYVITTVLTDDSVSTSCELFL